VNDEGGTAQITVTRHGLQAIPDGLPDDVPTLAEEFSADQRRSSSL